MCDEYVREIEKLKVELMFAKEHVELLKEQCSRLTEICTERTLLSKDYEEVKDLYKGLYRNIVGG